jgi:hypothetical protein
VVVLRVKVDVVPFPYATETTSYPVSVDLLCVGEYRVGVDTGGGTVWTDWARVASTLAENFPSTYDVVEVRSQLKG